MRYAGTDTHIGKTEIRLPALPREHSTAAKADSRGAADSAGLWLAHHNERTHKRRCPTAPAAKAIFEAAEGARVEAIGANNMAGVKGNLTKRLEQRYAHTTIGAPDSGDDGAVAEAVRLMIREALTGQKPPPSTEMVMDLWRPWITNRAGDIIEEMRKCEDDQTRFADAARKLIGKLQSDLGDATNDGQDADDEDENGSDDPSTDDGSSDEAQSASGDDESGGDDSQSMDQDGEAAGMAADDSTEIDADSEMDGMTDGESPGGDPGQQQNYPAFDPDAYRIYTAQYDEIVNAQDLCDPEELDRLRALLDRHMDNPVSYTHLTLPTTPYV